jgi:hypothetical protein
MLRGATIGDRPGEPVRERPLSIDIDVHRLAASLT